MGSRVGAAHGKSTGLLRAEIFSTDTKFLICHVTNRHSGSGGIMVLVCHVISQDQAKKGSGDFKGSSPSR